MATKAIRKMSIKKNDGTFSEPVPIGAYAKDVVVSGGESVESEIANLKLVTQKLKPIATTEDDADVYHNQKYIVGYDFITGGVTESTATKDSVKNIIKNYDRMFVDYGDQIRLVESKIPIITMNGTTLEIDYNEISNIMIEPYMEVTSLSAQNMEPFDEHSLYVNTNNYADMFQWQDDNPNKEDRSGYFVTMQGERIKKATSADTYLLGVTFDNLAESSDSYQWNMVAMLGQVNVRDDGTCVTNLFCKPNNDGIATKSDDGYRVINRVNNNVVTILFK